MCMELLLRKGADPNKDNSLKEGSPLHHAI
jgi:hypothetical protein